MRVGAVAAVATSWTIASFDVAFALLAPFRICMSVGRKSILISSLAVLGPGSYLAPWGQWSSRRHRRHHRSCRHRRHHSGCALLVYICSDNSFVFV